MHVSAVEVQSFTFRVFALKPGRYTHDVTLDAPSAKDARKALEMSLPTLSSGSGRIFYVACRGHDIVERWMYNDNGELVSRGPR